MNRIIGGQLNQVMLEPAQIQRKVKHDFSSLSLSSNNNTHYTGVFEVIPK